MARQAPERDTNLPPRIISLREKYLLQGACFLFANRNCRIVAKSEQYKQQIITWTRSLLKRVFAGDKVGWQLGL